jgi:hypothetical protein
MTSERAQAYGRVMKTLEDLGPSKLLAGEAELVREAADTLLFSEGPDGERVLGEVRGLARHLVDSGRWIGETADALVHDLEAAGPVAELLH